MLHRIDACVVVSRVVIGIVHKMHAQLFLKISKALSHIARDDVDLGHSRLAELFYLPLDQHLALDLDQRLRSLVGDGRKAAGGACSHYDSVINFIHYVPPTICFIR